MTVQEAIQIAEQFLPGESAPDGATDPRWQAIIEVSEFIDEEPEAIWQFIERWGVSSDSDLRTAVATCLLEHLLERHFEAFFPRVEAAVRGDRWFANTFELCSKFGQSQSPECSRRFDALLNEAHGLTRSDRTITVKSTVDPPRFADYERQARAVLATLEAGDQPDLTHVSQTFGADIEWLLCDLFPLNERTSGCESDGVIFSAAAVDAERILVLTGRTWCTRRRTQWEVPCVVECRLSGGLEPSLTAIDISVGNAELETLENHRGRSLVKAANLSEWLITFEVTHSGDDRSEPDQTRD